jgi:hypothetical protein
MASHPEIEELMRSFDCDNVGQLISKAEQVVWSHQRIQIE